jgi:diadenosine tetraphosphate (Ap4A) HIT family hydrolase
MMQCPFCELESSRILSSCGCAIAIRDGFPVTEGHTLVIPCRHVESIFTLSSSERAEIWEFLAEVRRSLSDELGVQAFNIGINDGFAAGQTIAHAHIHVIPRREGDVEDPRGGIRHVIAEKARYWGAK